MKTILSLLLHHANRNTLYGVEKSIFYLIKNKILTKYGKHQYYDVQFIEGKKCFSCKGTGLYPKHDHYTGWYHEPCWNCNKGWYKRPVWNILKVIEFGDYTFHQPYQRIYENPNITNKVIEGYITHQKSRLSKFALVMLFIIYDKTFFKRWYKNTGLGWRMYWWLPKNYMNNLLCILKKGTKSYPVNRLKDKLRPQPKQECTFSDLPF